MQMPSLSQQSQTAFILPEPQQISSSPILLPPGLAFSMTSQPPGQLVVTQPGVPTPAVQQIRLQPGVFPSFPAVPSFPVDQFSNQLTGVLVLNNEKTSS
jgi:hypothetical protein